MIEGVVTTAGDAIFYSQGDLSTTQETTLSLRNATVIQEDFSQNRTLSDTATSNTITITSTDTNTQVTDVDLQVGGTLPPPQVITQPPPRPRFNCFNSWLRLGKVTLSIIPNQLSASKH